MAHEIQRDKEKDIGAVKLNKLRKRDKVLRTLPLRKALCRQGYQMNDDKLFDLAKHLMTVTLTLLGLLVLYFRSMVSPSGYEYVIYIIGGAFLIAFSSAAVSAYKVVMKAPSEESLKYLRFSMFVTIPSIFVTAIKLAEIA